MDVLRRSQTHDLLPVQGHGHATGRRRIGDDVVDDVAWSYEDPLPESRRWVRFLSFDDSRVDRPARPARRPADASGSADIGLLASVTAERGPGPRRLRQGGSGVGDFVRDTSLRGGRRCRGRHAQPARGAQRVQPARCRRSCGSCGGTSARHDDVRAIILTGAGRRGLLLRASTGTRRIEEGYLDDEHPTEREDASTHTGFVSTPFQYNDPGSNINPKQNDLWKPVIAAVNGMACGGALYLLGRVRHHHRGGARDLLRPPRDVRHGGRLRVDCTCSRSCPSARPCAWPCSAPTSACRRPGPTSSDSSPRSSRPPSSRERALWVARAIASAPVMAVQGTLRAVWMAHELARREALAQVSTLVLLGHAVRDIAGGQEIVPRRAASSGGCAELLLSAAGRDSPRRGAPGRSTTVLRARRRRPGDVRAAGRLRRDRREPVLLGLHDPGALLGQVVPEDRGVVDGLGQQPVDVVGLQARAGP